LIASRIAFGCRLVTFTLTRCHPVPSLFPYTTLFRSSDLLLRQWRSEAHRELQGSAPTIFMAGGGTSKATWLEDLRAGTANDPSLDRKSTRLNSSHGSTSYAVFCLKNKKHHQRHD